MKAQRMDRDQLLSELVYLRAMAQQQPRYYIQLLSAATKEARKRGLI